MNPYPFCSFCLLLRRWVLACSTYLLAIMTDHPCRDLLFMYMRCVPHDYPYWLCLSPHPKPLGRWGSGTFLVRTYYVSQAKRYRISVIFKIPYDEFSFIVHSVWPTFVIVLQWILWQRWTASGGDKHSANRLTGNSTKLVRVDISWTD